MTKWLVMTGRQDHSLNKVMLNKFLKDH